MMDDMLRLETKDMMKLKEILDFLLRGSGRELTSVLSHQITIKEKREQTAYHSYNYNTYGTQYVIYKQIPDLLDMGVLQVKVQDYSSILDIYLKEVRKRLSTEESAENVLESLENHEEAIGI